MINIQEWGNKSQVQVLETMSNTRSQRKNKIMFAVALVLYTLAMALAIGVGDWIHGIGYYVTGLIQLLMMIILC